MLVRPRRAALHATARVALGSSALSLVLAGCGGKAELVPQPDSSIANGQEAADPGAAAPPTAEPAASEPAPEEPAAADPPAADQTCVGPTPLTSPPSLPGPSRAEFECCTALMASRAADWGTPEGAVLRDSDPFANCCRAIIMAVEIDSSLRSSATLAWHPCCSLQGQRDSLWGYQLCAPWGPPVPPAIDWAAA
jgi:hypothetical protein